jgi:hypothetical protein
MADSDSESHLLGNEVLWVGKRQLASLDRGAFSAGYFDLESAAVE